MKPMYERWCPQEWASVCGQDTIVRRVKLLRERGELLGQVFWLTSMSGQGKTTIATDPL